MDDPETGRIAVPGGTIWYRMIGKDRPGIPLLVLHGGPGVPHDYLRTLDALADERPIIYYDQLGCGHSDQPDDLSLWQITRFAEELAAVIAHLQLSDVHLLGQSWGTMLALEFMATREASMVRSLVLAAPAINVARWVADQRQLLRGLPRSVQQVVRDCEASGDTASGAYEEAMMAFYRRHVCRMEPWPDLLMASFTRLAAPVYHTMWGPSEFTQTGNLNGFDRSVDLQHLDLPILFTCGEFDEATPQTTRDYCAMAQRGRYAEFAGAAHLHHLEAEAAFNSTLREFLQAC